jgi:hypothetical protein
MGRALQASANGATVKRLGAYWITTVSKKAVVIFKFEPGSGRS